jgi:flagellar hook-associated protein 3 FlgL
MANRVSTAYSNQVFVSQIAERRKSLEIVRQKISSGLEVSLPSDDPGRAGNITQLQSTIQRLDRHKDRITQLQGYLDHQEGVLTNSTDILNRAKEIAAQAANETTSPAVRAQLAGEVFELRDALVEIANTKYLGRYVYGGQRDDTQPYIQSTTPYTVPATVTDPARLRYVLDSVPGRTTTRTVQISDDDTVQVNSDPTIFSSGISGLERLGRALAGYRSDPEDFSTLPTGAGVQMIFPTDQVLQTNQILQSLDALESSRTGIQTELSNVGARSNRMSQAIDFIGTIRYNAETSRAGLQDADPIEAASQFQSLQTSLEGVLASGARIGNISLLDFL